MKTLNSYVIVGVNNQEKETSSGVIYSNKVSNVVEGKVIVEYNSPNMHLNYGEKLLFKKSEGEEIPKEFFKNIICGVQDTFYAIEPKSIIAII